LPPPNPFDLARGLREAGMADLALEYLGELSAKSPPDVMAVLPLERAKCLLELANHETDESVRSGMMSEAKAAFDQFLKTSAKHPRSPEASVALARLLTLEGKSKLNTAKRIPEKAAAHAEATKARPLFEEAARRYTATAAGLEKLSQADGLLPSRKAELIREFYQAILDRGINLYYLADSYIDPKGPENNTKAKAATDAGKAFDELAKKDPLHPLCWVARAWSGETLYLLGEPVRAERIFQDILTDARKQSSGTAAIAAAAGTRMARFFQLREQFVKLQNDPVGRGTVREACRSWLRDYPSARPTAETYAVMYYHGTVLLNEATRQENLIFEKLPTPKPNEPKPIPKVIGVKPEAMNGLREAEAEFRKIVRTDNEYTARAANQRAKALRWLVGNVTRPITSFLTFDECYMAAQVHMNDLRSASADDRPKTAQRVIDLLERAHTLPVSAESARDALAARISLAQAYTVANRPHHAAILAESLARSVRSPAQVARAGLVALQAYESAAPANDEARATDRERMVALCVWIEKTAANDPLTDEVRLKHGVLLSQMGRGVDMFEILSTIPSRYPKVSLARLYQGVAAYELVRPRGPNEAAKTDDLPDAKKAEVYRRAVAALSSVPAPAAGAGAEEAATFVKLRLQLAQLHLTTPAGYATAEKVAIDAAKAATSSPDLHPVQKQALAMQAERFRLRAVYRQVQPLFQENKFAAAAERLAPLLDEIVKSGPASTPNLDGEAADAAKLLDADRIDLVLVPMLNARIREGAVGKTGELFDQLQKFGGNLDTTARLVQQGIASVRPAVEALRKEGKTDEATKLVVAVTGMVDKLAGEKNLSSEVRINLGRAFKSLGEYGKAIELLAMIPAPADRAFLAGDPKVTPPIDETNDARTKREAAYEAEKAAAIAYRVAQLELLRCARLDQKFERCDAILDDVLGKDRKSGWGQKFADFRRESLYLSEAKAADAKTPKDRITHWNAAIQGWRGWADEYKRAIDGLKPKADDPEEKVNEVRRRREALKPIWYDLTTELYRCSIEAQVAVNKSDPAKLSTALTRQAANVYDFEKNNTPLPDAIKARLFRLLDTYPELKEAYTKAGGTELLKAPAINNQ
jgi:hypothetical protein